MRRANTIGVGAFRGVMAVVVGVMMGHVGWAATPTCPCWPGGAADLIQEFQGQECVLEVAPPSSAASSVTCGVDGRDAVCTVLHEASNFFHDALVAWGVGGGPPLRHCLFDGEERFTVEEVDSQEFAACLGELYQAAAALGCEVILGPHP